MPAKVKARQMVTIQVEIPASALSRVKATLRPYKVEILHDDEEMIEVSETDWYRNLKPTPGENMRASREKLGWTQAQLGVKLGNKTRHYVSAMETGARPISKVVALKLSEIFSVSVERFIG